MSVKRINETRLGLSVHVGLLCPNSSIQSLQLSAGASPVYIKKGHHQTAHALSSKQVIAKHKHGQTHTRTHLKLQGKLAHEP